MKKFIPWMFLILSLNGFSAYAQETTEGDEVIDAQAQESAAEAEVQEVKYVTDKLRLSLYRSANGNSGTIKLLTSGDELKLLERTGNYAKVITNEGLVGWVKTGFLVSEPTASFQLVEEKKKNEILVNQLEQYSDTQKLVEDYENTISLMKSDETKMSSEIEELKKNFEQAQQRNQELQQQVEDAKQGKIGLLEIIDIVRQYWYVLAGVLVIFVLSGFLAGKRMVEAQVKRRFQGMKVW